MRNSIPERVQAIDRDPMRARATSRAAFLTGLALSIVMAAPPAQAQIVPPGSMVEGMSIGDWGFDWWQWIFGITSPDPWGDTSGVNQNFGQMPPVFYTCGAAGPAAGVPTTRSFTVPADMYILASLSSTSAFFEPGIDPPNLCTVELPAFIDATSSLSFSLDGVPISQVDLFNNHRETSSLGLTSVIVPGNPYFPGKAGSYPDSCGDGYYVMIEPLPPGPHTIECGFTHPVGAVLNHTNEITVLEPLMVDFVEVQKEGIGGVSGLSGAQSVAVSPDGAHVYVAASSTVAVFSRDSVNDGELTFVEVQTNNVGGVTGLAQAKAVAVSPDGAHVYVAAEFSNTIAVFSRDTGTGALTFEGTTAVSGNPRSLVVSPDNNHVYVARLVADAVSVYARDTATGLLTFVQSLQDGVGGVDGLNNPWAVTISPDGDHVYTAAVIDDAVAVFARNSATGQLTFVGFERDGINGVDGLNGANGVTVSPDNAHVYVTSNADSSVAVFERDAGTGALSFVEVHKSGDFGLLLAYSTWASVSPDGGYVYVSSRNQDALAAFRRDPMTGSLTFVDLERDNLYGVDGLDETWTLAVSPDGLNIYAAAQSDDSVAVFLPEPSAGLLLLSGGTFLLVVGRHKERRQRNRMGRAGS